MKVRNKQQTWIGHTSEFNVHAMWEAIVGFEGENGEFDGQDSMFISEMDVFLDNKGEWKDMNQAFEDKDLIPNNENTCFREPVNEEERTRGYY